MANFIVHYALIIRGIGEGVNAPEGAKGKGVACFALPLLAVSYFQGTFCFSDCLALTIRVWIRNPPTTEGY